MLQALRLLDPDNGAERALTSAARLRRRRRLTVTVRASIVRNSGQVAAIGKPAFKSHYAAQQAGTPFGSERSGGADRLGDVLIRLFDIVDERTILESDLALIRVLHF